MRTGSMAKTMAMTMTVAGVLALGLTGWPRADAAESNDLVEVVAKDELTVARGTRDDGPSKQRGIHPKLINSREKHELDRFALLRFDSDQFGKNARAAALLLQATEGDTHKGRHRFRVYGVRDGDEQDEAFEFRKYDPDAEGALFKDTRRMLDSDQVVSLGTFATESGKAVQFTSAMLTALVRADENGVVTLVITRETESGENSTFATIKSETPPKLVIKPTK